MSIMPRLQVRMQEVDLIRLDAGICMIIQVGIWLDTDTQDGIR